MVIGGIELPCKRITKQQGCHQILKTENKIEDIYIRRSLHVIHDMRGVTVASDHHLVAVKFKLKLRKNGTSERTQMGRRTNLVPRVFIPSDQRLGK